MAVLSERKRREWGWWHLVGFVGVTTVLLLLALRVVASTSPIIRVAGYTLSMSQDHHTSRKPVGISTGGEPGAFVLHAWIGTDCVRTVWLTPSGSTLWLL